MLSQLTSLSFPSFVLVALVPFSAMTRSSSREGTETDISVLKEIPGIGDTKTQVQEEENFGQHQTELSDEHRQFRAGAPWYRRLDPFAFDGP